MASERTETLEPRVAKLEVGLDRLTEDVRDLAGVVRSQGDAMETEIQKLVVAVTQAAGPRKTEWGVIASFVMLIMMIGSAAFWPLHNITRSIDAENDVIRQELTAHLALDNHPVGQALITRLEEDCKECKSELMAAISNANVHTDTEIKNLKSILELEMKLRDEKLQAKHDALQEKTLEWKEFWKKTIEMDLNELNTRRLIQ